MTSPSTIRKTGSDRGDYGFARARDLAFDAVLTLWRKRKAQGVRQSDIAEVLNRDPAWVSRQLKGPGNWTLRTIGELVEAMDGELEIAAFPLEEPIYPAPNYDAYSGYGRMPETRSINGTTVTGPFISTYTSAATQGIAVSGTRVVVSYSTYSLTEVAADGSRGSV